jgi:hypothetical protein
MGLPTSVRAVDGGRIRGAQPVPRTIEFVARQSLPNSKIAHMKFHGRYITAPPNLQTVVNALYTSLAAAWSSNLGPLMATTSHLLDLSARDMAAVTNPVFISTGSPADGTGTEDPMPSQDAIVLTEHVNLRGRGLSGRMYWSGWTELANAGAGQITPAAQTAMNGFGSALFAAIQANTLTPAVAQVERANYISLTGANIPHRAAGPIDVTSYTCRDLFWDTQRRRDVG